MLATIQAFHDRVAALPPVPTEEHAYDAVADASLTWSRVLNAALGDAGVARGDYDAYFADLERLMRKVGGYPALLERAQWYHALYFVLRTRGPAAVAAALEDSIAGAKRGRTLSDEIRHLFDPADRPTVVGSR